MVRLISRSSVSCRSSDACFSASAEIFAWLLIAVSETYEAQPRSSDPAAARAFLFAIAANDGMELWLDESNDDADCDGRECC